MQSFKKSRFIFFLLFFSFFLLTLTLFNANQYPLGRAALLILAHLPLFLFILAFGWLDNTWGVATLSFSCIAVVLCGLILREPAIVLLPAVFLAAAPLIYRGLENWNSPVRAAAVRVERLDQQLNEMSSQVAQSQQTQALAEMRLRRYQQLRQVANSLVNRLPLRELLEGIVQAAADLIRGADYILLYLVDPGGLHLELLKVWRRDGHAPIKAKKGDQFDAWVMRQGQPLLVEDALHDFRFPEASRQTQGRQVGSLLSVPLVSKDRFLGVLRLESSQPRQLGVEELRLGGILGDLASLGVDNSLLFNRMLQLSKTDDLTGLAVRGHFMERLEQALSAATQNRQSLSLLLIDIDRFKDYNDTFGHTAGDKLLKELGVILQEFQRPEEMAARLGGEEFVYLMPGGGPEEALRRSEEIRQRVEMTPIRLRREMTRTTVSIGVASFPKDGTTSEALLSAADRRLYQAKGAGRNRVVADG